MNLEELQKHWQKFGEEDPMWAILTIPEMKDNNWNPEEFFQRGVDEIAEAFGYIDDLDVTLNHGRALDFGCGVGRLTQAMAAQFEEAHGVDIAPSMIETARRFNKFGGKCHYHVNDQNNLSLFPDNHFDFIYTVIVLQHMHSKYSLPYIAEFLRVLRSGGVLIFQLPSELKPEYARPTKPPAQPKSFIRQLLAPLESIYHRVKNRIRPPQPFKPRMEMHGVPKNEMLAFLAEKQGIVLTVQEDNWAGPPWNSYTYFVTKA